VRHYETAATGVRLTALSLASPLTEIPDTPIANEQQALPEEPIVKPKKVREKKQIIDAVTELHEGTGRRDRLADALPLKDISNITAEQHFLPRSSLTMRLMEIREDPLAHFLPMTTKNNQSFFCAAPPGLSEELADLFLRPVEVVPKRTRHVSPTENGNKRIRLDEEEDEVELGRREMSIAQSPAPFKLDEPAGGDLEFGNQSLGFDDSYQLDLGHAGEENINLEGMRSRSVSMAPSQRSRFSTPGAEGMWNEGDASYADMTCPIAIFDSRHPAQYSQATQEEEVVPELQEEGTEEKGYSKNTVKALALIRKELQPSEEGESQKLSFKTMATKVCIGLKVRELRVLTRVTGVSSRRGLILL
jgi:cohesin complex subunit SCC1